MVRRARTVQRRRSRWLEREAAPNHVLMLLIHFQDGNQEQYMIDTFNYREYGSLGSHREHVKRSISVVSSSLKAISSAGGQAPSVILILKFL